MKRKEGRQENVLLSSGGQKGQHILFGGISAADSAYSLRCCTGSHVEQQRIWHWPRERHLSNRLLLPSTFQPPNDTFIAFFTALFLLLLTPESTSRECHRRRHQRPTFFHLLYYWSNGMKCLIKVRTLSSLYLLFHSKNNDCGRTSEKKEKVKNKQHSSQKTIDFRWRKERMTALEFLLPFLIAFVTLGMFTLRICVSDPCSLDRLGSAGGHRPSKECNKN